MFHVWAIFITFLEIAAEPQPMGPPSLEYIKRSLPLITDENLRYCSFGMK